jgi:PEP-CTERM motif
MKTKTLVTLAALAVVMLLPAAVQADPLVISPATSFGSPALVVAGGVPVVFTGTLTNETSGTWFLGGSTFTFTGPGTVTIDTSPYDLSYPLTLAPGAVFGPSAFFTAAAALGTPPGTYQGSFSVIITDANGGFLFDITQEFFIAVREGQVIPEPASMLLLGGGLLGLAAARRRKRRQLTP